MPGWGVGVLGGSPRMRGFTLGTGRGAGASPVPNWSVLGVVTGVNKGAVPSGVVCVTGCTGQSWAGPSGVTGMGLGPLVGLG